MINFIYLFCGCGAVSLTEKVEITNKYGLLQVCVITSSQKEISSQTE